MCRAGFCSPERTWITFHSWFILCTQYTHTRAFSNPLPVPKRQECFSFVWNALQSKKSNLIPGLSSLAETCPCCEHRTPKFSVLGYLSRLHHDTTVASTFSSLWSDRFSASGLKWLPGMLLGVEGRKAQVKYHPVLSVYYSASSPLTARFICLSPIL